MAELDQAHWTAGVCKVLRNLLLNLFRLTEPTPPEALHVFARLTKDPRIMDSLLPGCRFPSSHRTLAGWEEAFMDLIPARSRSTHVLREVPYTVHHVITSCFYSRLLPLAELTHILRQHPHYDKSVAGRCGTAYADLYWGYGLTQEFKTMRLSDHYFPEDFLAFEQSFAAHCQYTHLIDNAIDMVKAKIAGQWQASAFKNPDVNHKACKSIFVKMHGIRDKDAVQRDTSRLVLLVCSRLEVIAFGEGPGRRLHQLPKGPSAKALEVMFRRSTEGVTELMDLHDMVLALTGFMEQGCFCLSVATAAAGLWAALTCTHVATPDCSILYLRQRWSWASMSVETASLLSRAWQHSVLAAMADGDICGHISMSQADVPAAMAAVLASIPAIAAGRTSYCVPDDEADKALQLMLFDIKDRGNARLAGLSMEDRAEVRKAEQAAEQAYQHAFNADNAACGPRNHAERLAKGPGRGLSGAQQLHAARQQVAAAEAEAQRQQDLAEEAARKAKEVFLQQQSQAAAAAEQAAAELLREEEAEAARAAQTAERSQQQAAKRAAKKARQKQRKALATPAAPEPPIGCDKPTQTPTTAHFLEFLTMQLSSAPGAQQTSAE